MGKKIDLSNLKLNESGRVELNNNDLDLLEKENLAGGFTDSDVLLWLFCGADNAASCNNIWACEGDTNAENCTNRQNCNDGTNDGNCTNRAGCTGDTTNNGDCNPP